jgi:hypothetical protein
LPWGRRGENVGLRIGGGKRGDAEAEKGIAQIVKNNFVSKPKKA